MTHVLLLNCAVHLASQSCPRESRGVSASLGNVCACVACVGRLSTGSVPLWVEYMYLWFANFTAVGLCDGSELCSGVVLETKWPVLPESVMS